MLLEKLLNGCSAVGSYDGRAEITSVCCNSKEVTKGSMFIALSGRKTDGGKYVDEAFKKGAACVVCEGEPFAAALPYAFVSDARSACARIFSNFYGNPDVGMKTVCVTGTNGKTTVASLLEHIFARDGRKPGLLGTVIKRSDGKFFTEEDTMTTPDPMKLYGYLHQMKKDGCDTVVMEASSHALAFSKLDGMHVDVGLFTNLTPEHLDFHGSMENYYRAKRKLAEKADSFFVNYDDHYGKRICRDFPDAVAVSADPSTAANERVFATAAMYRSLGFEGIKYVFCCKETVFPITSQMIGINALYNTLMAAATSLYLGISPEVITSAVADFKGVDGRFETVCGGVGVPRVIIDYAHTPDSFEKALVQVRMFMRRSSRLIVVFGCGGERDKTKRAAMGEAAEKYADLVVVTDDNPRGEDPDEIRYGILCGIKNKKNAVEIKGRREALEYAVQHSRQKDVVLILGKGHEEYIIDKCGKHPFPEREIIRNFIFAKYGVL